MSKVLQVTLNTKDREKLQKEFQKTREQYIREVNNLRQKYRESLINLVLAYSGAH